jgi:hypothetical protein
MNINRVTLAGYTGRKPRTSAMQKGGTRPPSICGKHPFIASSACVDSTSTLNQSSSIARLAKESCGSSGMPK